jgi:sec-independent protein translocase protein TatC
MVLFALGGFFAYLTISNGLRFLLGLAGEQFTPLIQVNSYLSFLMAMLLVFGLSFEFPLLVVLLNLAGVVSAKRLRRWRRMVIFCVFAFAAVATPTQDPITMLVMAVPICLLYEVAVVVARTHDRRVAKREMESAYHLLPDEQPSPLEMGSA